MLYEYISYRISNSVTYNTRLNIKSRFNNIWIPVKWIRRSHDRLSFIHKALQQRVLSITRPREIKSLIVSLAYSWKWGLLSQFRLFLYSPSVHSYQNTGCRLNMLFKFKKSRSNLTVVNPAPPKRIVVEWKLLYSNSNITIGPCMSSRQ